ncbi:MAG: hypothetical protein RR212_10480, partial [Bacteroidales bacterium]
MKTILIILVSLSFFNKPIFGIGINNQDSSAIIDSCNLDLLAEMQSDIDNLTDNNLLIFLYTFDGRCKDNVEYSEYSNELLYSLLCHKKAAVLIKIISKNKQLPFDKIREAIESPVHDGIDLQKAYDNVKSIKLHKEICDMILKSILIAMRNIS